MDKELIKMITLVIGIIGGYILIFNFLIKYLIFKETMFVTILIIYFIWLLYLTNKTNKKRYGGKKENDEE